MKVRLTFTEGNEMKNRGPYKGIKTAKDAVLWLLSFDEREAADVIASCWYVTPDPSMPEFRAQWWATH